jgi:sugar lactone lactonase YvrE
MFWTLALLAVSSTEFSRLVPDTTVEKVASGFQFTEGPVWIKKDGCLLFSDIPADTIYRLDPRDGKVTVYRKPSGNSNGLTLDGKGRLIACEHGNRRVSREAPAGKVESIASIFEEKKLNSPNDVVVARDGSLFFTDPPYGIDAKAQEQPCQGVYRLSPGGKLKLLVSDFDRPNGLAFSPDEKVLYIADSSARMHIRAFDVKPDGTLENGRLFAKLTRDREGGPDGLKVDRKGNIFTTGPGGIWVYAPDGKLLGIVDTPEVPANCGWGGPDGKDLYITARTGLYRIRTTVGGKI